MAKLFAGKKKFKASDHDELGTFEALPPSWYNAKIVDSDMIENSKKTGSYLKLKFEIVDGKFKGRLVWMNLNLIHNNEETVDIAERTLTSICNAIGIPVCEDSDELHNKDMQIKLVVTTATSQYPTGNDIKGIKAIEGKAKPSKPSSKKKPSKPSGEKKKKPKVTFGNKKK